MGQKGAHAGCVPVKREVHKREGCLVFFPFYFFPFWLPCYQSPPYLVVLVLWVSPNLPLFHFVVKRRESVGGCGVSLCASSVCGVWGVSGAKESSALAFFLCVCAAPRFLSRVGVACRLFVFWRLFRGGCGEFVFSRSSVVQMGWRYTGIAILLRVVSQFGGRGRWVWVCGLGGGTQSRRNPERGHLYLYV